ncbi:uncharacterized [Tachysurus ichikawai]
MWSRIHLLNDCCQMYSTRQFDVNLNKACRDAQKSEVALLVFPTARGSPEEEIVTPALVSLRLYMGIQ